jgi:hypothetical protein
MPAVFSSAQTQPEPGTGIEGVITIAPIRQDRMKGSANSRVTTYILLRGTESESMTVSKMTKSE